MYSVKTVVRPSPIAGYGVFADENIPKGKVVWEYHSSTSTYFTKKDIEDLQETKPSKIEEILDKGLYIVSLDGYVLCTDNRRFTNHSDLPNVGGNAWNQRIALRDIKKGEELTESYFSFDRCPWTEELEKKFNIWWPLF